MQASLREEGRGGCHGEGWEGVRGQRMVLISVLSFLYSKGLGGGLQGLIRAIGRGMETVVHLVYDGEFFLLRVGFRR